MTIVELHPSKVDYQGTMYAFEIFATEAKKIPVTCLSVTATESQAHQISASQEEEAKVVANWKKTIGVIKSKSIDWIRVRGSIPSPLLNLLRQLKHPNKITTLSFENYDGEQSKWELAPCKTYKHLKMMSFVDSNAVGMDLEQCGSVKVLDVERSQAFAKAHPGHPKMIDFILGIIPQLNGVTHLIVLGEGEATLPEVVAKAEQLSEQLPNLGVLTTSITAETIGSDEVQQALNSPWLSKLRSIEFEFHDGASETVINRAKEQLCRRRTPTTADVDTIRIVYCD